MRLGSQDLADEILCQFHEFRRTDSNALMIGIQGIQGIGKTTLCQELVQHLSSHSLRVCTLSLDDFYFTHDKLNELAMKSTKELCESVGILSIPFHNVKDQRPCPLFQTRGLPGTHDLPLLEHVFQSLTETKIILPRFDKKLHQGQGDRFFDENPFIGPVDIVLLEGWCLGFQSLNVAPLTFLNDWDWTNAMFALLDYNVQQLYRKTHTFHYWIVVKPSLDWRLVLAPWRHQAEGKKTDYVTQMLKQCFYVNELYLDSFYSQISGKATIILVNEKREWLSFSKMSN